MPRYTYRRLTLLPATEEALRRSTMLNAPGMFEGVSVRRTVMKPGAAVPACVEEQAGLILTLSGRGVMLIDGDRLEISANDVVFIPAGVEHALQTLGSSDWVYVIVQAPAAETREG